MVVLIYKSYSYFMFSRGLISSHNSHAGDHTEPGSPIRL